MGPVWHCDHLVGDRKLGCCLIIVTVGSCLEFVITSLGKGGLIAVLLLSLVGPVWHCDHLVGERRLGCLLLLPMVGPVWHCNHLVRKKRSDCCLIAVIGVLSDIVITLFAERDVIAVLLLSLVSCLAL